MSQKVKTVQEWMSEEFGAAALKAVSENGTVEEVNAFVSGAQTIKESLEGLEKSNADLKAEKESLSIEKTNLEKQLSDEQAKSADLTTKLQSAESDRDKYKKSYDEKADAGKNLPDNDFEMPEAVASLPDGHPDKLAAQAKAKAIKATAGK